MLSDAEVNQDLYSVSLELGVDPTGSGMTKGDLLILYLGWFTDMALIANAALKIKGRPKVASGERLIRRRFAIPCFEDTSAESFASGRAKWARMELSRALRRAQVVADTLHGKWDTLDVKSASAILEAVKELPDHALPDILVASPSIREPVAAGASLVDEQLEQLSASGSIVRQYVLVIDAGAGTTDFAMFLARRTNDLDPIRYSLVSPSVRLSRIAGNEFDDILRNVVLKSCGINPKSGAPRSEEDFGIIKRQLSATIRNIKQELFTSKSQKYSVKLTSNAKGEVLLADLMSDRRMKLAAKELSGIVQEILETVFTEKVVAPLALSRGKVAVHVLLTGGSSQVGIVKSLASSKFHVNGIDVVLKELVPAPSWINRLERELADLVTAAYPQCAVAIGGSSPEMPEELPELGGLIEAPMPGRRVIERFQSGGV
jgi:molecular chaperone HscA